MNGGVGWALLAVAVVVAPGRVALRRPRASQALAAHRRRSAAPDASLPLVLDLVAAALRSGRPFAEALALAAPAGRPEVADVLNQVAALSRLGAEAEHAWAAAPRDGPLAEVARVAIRSAASGLKLAAGMERLAAEIRTERATAATVRAHRAAVLAMAPLAACFLPSFVCLGVIPVVVGVARNALSGLS
jgi:Flp pilus assembly protein TadB